MKKLIIVLSIFLLGLDVYSNELDPYWDAVKIVPEYKEYFEEYAQRLYNDFQPRKHFIGFTSYDNFWYTIFRDGTVKNIGNFFSNNKYTQYCKDIIMETKPKPFPPEIKDDFIVVDLWLGYHNSDECEVRLYRRTKSEKTWYWQKLYNVDSVNLINISIEKKNYLHKLW